MPMHVFALFLVASFVAAVLVSIFLFIALMHWVMRRREPDRAIRPARSATSGTAPGSSGGHGAYHGARYAPTVVAPIVSPICDIGDLGGADIRR